jgi:hypothetical protein
MGGAQAGIGKGEIHHHVVVIGRLGSGEKIVRKGIGMRIVPQVPIGGADGKVLTGNAARPKEKDETKNPMHLRSRA